MAKAVDKFITIECTIWERKGIERIERGKEWTLWLNANTTLTDVEDFYKVSESIFKDCIKAHKKSTDYQMQIMQSVIFDDSTSKTDRWVSDSWYSQDGEGIHLLPDTRYTNESRDIYLTKNVRKDLASYLG